MLIIRNIPFSRLFFLFLLLGFAIVLTRPLSAKAAEFFVISNLDGGDAIPGDGICNIQVSEVGLCTLRAAIQEGNALVGQGPHVIKFMLPPGQETIKPFTSLPMITESVVIDATSQPGYVGVPLIELNGEFASTGLILSADASTIRGLAINRFATGIHLFQSNQHQIYQNFIGTNLAGSQTFPGQEQQKGILLNNSAHNRIGGSTALGFGPNVISGNNIGIHISGPLSNNNQIQSNLIGSDFTGQYSLANLGYGISINLSSNNLIGGNQPEEGNLISGNLGPGLHLQGSSSSFNTITGNYIGTNLVGDSVLGNLGAGIQIFGAPLNFIGGEESGAGNLISGNRVSGLGEGHGIELIGTAASDNIILGNFIGTDASGSLSLGNEGDGIHLLNAPFNEIGGITPESKNIISGNLGHGLFLKGEARGNLIQGNFIGTSQSGLDALPNGEDGIAIEDASANRVGGSESGAGNFISGNLGNGIRIERTIERNVINNVIAGNFIGTNPSGTQTIPNHGDGIQFNKSPAVTQGPDNNRIGGLIGGDPQVSCQGECNLISGNLGNGIHFKSSGIIANEVQGNFIGTNREGNQALGNIKSGIKIVGARNNTIGGFAKGSGLNKRNLISGNHEFGIQISGGFAENNQILGNFIGTDRDGTSSLGNRQGIGLIGAKSNHIGGTSLGAGNLISGNELEGIVLQEAHSNTIEGNLIGTDFSAGAPLGNGSHGILLTGFTLGNRIGGTNSKSGNVIAHNLGNGVLVNGLRLNAIVGNSIFKNTQLGIDLFPNNITFNDLGDLDSGPNLLQNFPEITEAVPQENGVLVHGVLDSLPNKEYSLEFFVNEQCDPSGHGEGETLVGRISLNTGQDGIGAFQTFLPMPIIGVITATATDTEQNTSEFSPCITPQANPVIIPDLDFDRVEDALDNCPKDSNPEQRDGDSDGVGDVCDVCPQGDDTIDLVGGDQEGVGNGIPDCLEKSFSGSGERLPVAGGCSLQISS